MRHELFWLAMIAGLCGGVCPSAAEDGIRIVPGMGPQSTPPPAYRTPGARYNRPSARPGALGGGFIEFLATGGDTPETPRQPQPQAMTALRAEPAATQRMNAAPNPIYARQEVDYAGGEPGAIVIDTPHKFLYLVRPHGRAVRYGIGVGRPGFEWSGRKTISRKAEWPEWTPPAEMLLRRPDLPRHMDGGLANPLGARALYLGSSLYRIHGTNEPDTIGKNVSSGCIRMLNEDVTDLYEHVRVGTKVSVL